MNRSEDESGSSGWRRAAAGGPSRRRDRLIALTLFGASFAVYHGSPVTQMFDSRYLAAVSHSLLEEGRFSIPPISDLRPGEYRLHRVGGRLYHWYPNAPAVLNVPFVMAFDLLGFPVFEDGEFDRGNEVRIFRAAAAFATACAVALSYLLARIFLGRGWALALTLLFAFGTQLFSSASRAYWGHAWAVALLTLGLYLLLEPRFRCWGPAYVAAASALSWAFFCRPPMALSVLAVALLLTGRERRRFLPLFIVSGLAWAALFALHSQTVYGLWAPPYFSGERTLGRGLALSALLRPAREVALGTLFSPGRGLFVYTPIFALAPLLALRHWRRLRSKSLACAALAVIAAHWLLLCGVGEWWGGGCYGPRLFTDVVPWFFVLFALSLGPAMEPVGSPRRPRRGGWIAALAILGAWSVFVHARGAISWETRRWGDGDLQWARPALRRALFRYERLNNWRYPQFAAGIVPAPAPRHFVSWLCDGRERIERLRCGGTDLRVDLEGAPGDGFTARLSTGESWSGRLSDDGAATRRIARSGGRGEVTVLWGCGTVITKSFVCPPDGPDR